MIDPAAQKDTQGRRDALGSRRVRTQPLANPTAMSGVTSAGRRSFGARTTATEEAKPTTSSQNHVLLTYLTSAGTGEA
jgi:hypothetical protein